LSVNGGGFVKLAGGMAVVLFVFIRKAPVVIGGIIGIEPQGLGVVLYCPVITYFAPEISLLL
jgi:hypothetical protein